MRLDTEPDPLPYLPRLPDPVRPEVPHAATMGRVGTFAPPIAASIAPSIAPPVRVVERPRRRGRIALIVFMVLALGGVGVYLVKARGSTSADPVVAPTVTAAIPADPIHIETDAFSFSMPSQPVVEDRPTSTDEDRPLKIWTIQIEGGTLQVLAFPSSTPLDASLMQSKVDRVLVRLSQMSATNVVVNEPDPTVDPSARRVILENPSGRVFVEVLSTPDWIVLVSQGGGNREITPVYTTLLASFRFR